MRLVSLDWSKAGQPSSLRQTTAVDWLQASRDSRSLVEILIEMCETLAAAGFSKFLVLLGYAHRTNLDQ